MEVSLWAEIHRLKKIENLSNGAIARSLGCCYKTVAKALKMGTPPTRTRKKRVSILDPFKPEIEKILERYPSLSGERIYQKISQLGYQGGTTILRNYLREIRVDTRQQVYLEVHYQPGEGLQIDWGECKKIQIGEHFRKLYVFVAVLCYSRMIYIEFSLSQKKEDFYRCIVNALNFLGGVPKNLIIDNLKSAVIEGAGRTAKFHPEFQALCGHYLMKPVPCSPRHPEAKGRVESGVNYVKINGLAGYDDQLQSLEDYHRHAITWRDQIANKRIHSTTRKRPVDMFEEEKNHLHSLPTFGFDTDIVIPVVASPMARVTFDCNKYSVPAVLARKPLMLRADQRQIIIFDGVHEVARHIRCYKKGKSCTHPEHNKQALEMRKRNQISQTESEFDALGPEAQRFRTELSRRPIKAIIHMRRILKLAMIYGDAEVLQAINASLEFNTIDAAYVENLLQQHRRRRNLPSPTPLCPIRKELLEEVNFEQPNPSEYDDLFGI